MGALFMGETPAFLANGTRYSLCILHLASVQPSTLLGTLVMVGFDGLAFDLPLEGSDAARAEEQASAFVPLDADWRDYQVTTVTAVWRGPSTAPLNLQQTTFVITDARELAGNRGAVVVALVLFGGAAAALWRRLKR